MNEERRRYDELRTLVSLGSPVAVATFSHRDCPTCQQSLDNLEHQPDLATLDYEQSLNLLAEQARTLRVLQEDAERSVQDQVLIRTALERQVDEVRREVRAIRSDLVTPDDFPSVAELQKRLGEQNHRTDLQRLEVDVLEHTARMNEIAAEVRGVLLERERLGTAELTSLEAERLRQWTIDFRECLRAVGVSSFPIDDVELPVTGKPRVEGYDDVGFQASASDVIRLRWSYALSLMRHFGFQRV